MQLTLNQRVRGPESLVAHHHLLVCVGDPAAFGLPPYLASLITTETKLELTDALRQSLRPYGGTFAVAGGKNVMIERRDGPVAGAGVSENHVYVCDSYNLRAVRVELTYAAERVCQTK